MMLVRALLNKGQIILRKPSKNAVKGINEKIDFSAMTSIQVQNSISKLEFSNIKKLIIGGGSINKKLLEKIYAMKTECYQTFGMTETASHIAIRNLNVTNKNLQYKCLDHVKISTNRLAFSSLVDRTGFLIGQGIFKSGSLHKMQPSSLES